MSLQTEVLTALLPLNSAGVVSPAVVRKAAAYEAKAAKLCQRIISGESAGTKIKASKNTWTRDDFAAPVPPPEASTDSLALELSIKRDEIRQKLLDQFPWFIDNYGQEWPASPIAQMEFALKVEAAEDPLMALERAAAGQGSPLQALFIQSAYPEIYGMISMLLFAQISPKITPAAQSRADTFLLGRRASYALGEPVPQGEEGAAPPPSNGVNKEALTTAQKIAIK